MSSPRRPRPGPSRTGKWSPVAAKKGFSATHVPLAERLTNLEQGKPTADDLFFFAVQMTFGPESFKPVAQAVANALVSQPHLARSIADRVQDKSLGTEVDFKVTDDGRFFDVTATIDFKDGARRGNAKFANLKTAKQFALVDLFAQRMGVTLPTETLVGEPRLSSAESAARGANKPSVQLMGRAEREGATVNYEVVSKTGREEAPVFTVEVTYARPGEQDLTAQGEGSNKKMANDAAAARILKTLDRGAEFGLS